MAAKGERKKYSWIIFMDGEEKLIILSDGQSQR